MLGDSGFEDNSAVHFNLAFKELKQGLNGFFKDRVYVWPFHKLSADKDGEEVVSMIVQLEIDSNKTPMNSNPSGNNKS